MLRSDGTIYETEAAAAKVYAPFGVTEEMFHYVLTRGRPLGGCYFAYMDRDDGCDGDGAGARLTEEEKARAVELYDSGVQFKDIAKALGRSQVLSRDVMRWAGRPCIEDELVPCDAHIRERVKAVVKREEWPSAAWLSQRAGLGRSYFCAIHVNMKTSTLAKIMAVMPADVTAEWLLRGEGQPPTGIDFEPPEDG